MKIIEFIIILILSLINKSGVYFSDFDYTVCTTPSSCIHEQGHVLDDSLNFPSQTEKTLFSHFLRLCISHSTSFWSGY